MWKFCEEQKGTKEALDTQWKHGSRTLSKVHHVYRPTYTTAVIAPSYGTPAVLPVIYEAEPGFFVQLTPGSGKFLPGLFPNRGPSYFDQWLEPPFGQGNQVHWSTDGQKMGPYQPGGADPNKFTDKYSKRSADAEPKPEPQYYVRWGTEAVDHLMHENNLSFPWWK